MILIRERHEWELTNSSSLVPALESRYASLCQHLETLWLLYILLPKVVPLRSWIFPHILILAQVKQQIARQCILPFYKFFSKDDKQFMTPAGALILHWVFAAAWVIATPNSSDGYGFIIGIFIYGQLIIGGMIPRPSKNVLNECQSKSCSSYGFCFLLYQTDIRSPR